MRDGAHGGGLSVSTLEMYGLCPLVYLKDYRDASSSLYPIIWGHPSHPKHT